MYISCEEKEYRDFYFKRIGGWCKP